MTSMFLKEALLLLAGLAAGSTVAAGVYAFLVVIGVYPRLIGKRGKSSCMRRLSRWEDCLEMWWIYLQRK